MSSDYLYNKALYRLFACDQISIALQEENQALKEHIKHLEEETVN